MPDTQIISRTETHTILKTAASAQITIPHTLPILPIRNLVVFPGTVMPLNIGRPRSKALLDEVMPGDKVVGVITQKDPTVDDPGFEHLHTMGVICVILKLFKLPDQNQSIIVHGLTRFRLHAIIRDDPFLLGKIEVLDEPVAEGKELEALAASVRLQASRVIELSPNTPDEAQQVLAGIQSPGALADFLAANIAAETAEKQAMLEELEVEKRLRMIAAKLATQLDVLELQSKIQSQVKETIDKNQRRYYLQEQLKAIRKELGEGDASGNTEADNLRQKLLQANLPEPIMKEAERELNRLESVPSASPEYGVIRTYLQILSELPWSVETVDKLDLDKAREILDRDHHGLEKVKKRILEYLAVRKLKLQKSKPKSTSESDEPKQPSNPSASRDVSGAILCLVGPPGVGKTSLGKSIAEAMGRRFIRVALGGVRDEADIRGHRRTYIGAMPGRIISELRKAGTRNPVMMLDEIDKMSSDFRGDPASAMLEVLDPAQNHTFTDHYLDVPFDLSKILFIATANTMDTVPGPLRDRMEVIEIPGYTNADKLHIAKKYLVPRQLETNGLSRSQIRFTDAAIKEIIESYTREAGVRNLERQIGAVARAVAAEIVGGQKNKVVVDIPKVHQVLGAKRFEPELASRTAVPGIATGMAYTPYGGEILFIEATRMVGKGNTILTGQIGDVMKESATAAFSLIRSRAESLGIDPKVLAESDIHIHVPAGAVPKDGPSAGVAMFTALASLLTNRPVRHDVAMTGEITLRGLVLPIGGLKEKTLAAKRAGIKVVIVPKRNEKDLEDVPTEVKKTLKFHFVSTVDEVLQIALKPTGKQEKSPKKRPVKTN
ncbi:MAG: Lon protease [Phycisphaerae bacterium]|jgi:ATP-dependent Lon protease|nr:MAG: Lon protease [Phycisphaerae bacterium]